MIAADKGHVLVVQLLLQRPGVHPNSKDVINWTPVMIAAYNGHESVVRLLQDVNPKSQSVDGLLIKPENVQQLEEEGTSLESSMSGLQLDTSAGPIQTTNERMFDEVKHKLADDFLLELDNKVAGGQIASKTEWGGGVEIIWNKKLKNTAGQANWMMERATVLHLRGPCLNSACICGSKHSGPNNVRVCKAIFLAIWLSKSCSHLVRASAWFVAPGLYIIQKLN